MTETRILIVEDDDSLRQLYEQALRLSGYIIIGCAKNGLEGVELFKNSVKKPDIIIMDHRMPVKTGLEATREILELSLGRLPKIIFASADTTIKEEALSLGATCFQKKPFTLQFLMKCIKNVMDESIIAR